MVPLFHLETVRLRVVSCPKYHNMVSVDSQLRINIRNYQTFDYQTFDNLQKMSNFAAEIHQLFAI